MAASWSSFQRCATSFAKGSSGLGAPKRACIERRIVLICRAGDQLPKGVGVLLGQNGSQLWWRLTLQDVETDAAEFVNVGVVDLGEKTYLGRCHGVIIRKEELELEYAT